MSFNWLVYRYLNPDLFKAGLRTPAQYIQHYLKYGMNERRIFSIYQITPDFNHQEYLINNEDLRGFDDIQLELHWLEYGIKENRKYINSKIEYINGIDKIYWINLDRSVSRRHYMEKLLSKINVENERIKGCDGLIDNTIISNYRLNAVIGTKYEYGCLLSHLMSIKRFSESNLERCLIFEDDVSLYFMKYWKDDINTIISEAPDDWDIILLAYTDLHCGKYNKLYVNWHRDISSTVAYIINKKGANKVMSMFIDGKWTIEGEKHVSDYIIYKKCVTYVYKYSYFTTNDLGGSNIHSGNLNYHSNSRKMAELLWLENKE
jgi:GR25 family glycosyltransferase involved in LPS biosynthesis